MGSVPELDGFGELVGVGRGGYATVYRARDLRLGRDVAIKVLHGALAHDAAARFETEARAMAALSWHPNILVVHDVGTTHDGRPFLVTEYLPDGSFADRLRADGPLPADEVRVIGVQLASALDAVHEAGIVHRDVKPSNVLIGRAGGEAKLADFGISWAPGNELTGAGMVVGTTMHTAPEVLQGEQARRSADIWGLGSTLYTLLDGHPPFDREPAHTPMALALKVISDPVPQPRVTTAGPGLLSVIQRCLDKDPTRRPKTAADIAGALAEGTVLEPPAGVSTYERTTETPLATRPVTRPAGQRAAALTPDPTPQPRARQPISAGRTTTSAPAAAPVRRPATPTPHTSTNRGPMILSILALCALGVAAFLGYRAVNAQSVGDATDEATTASSAAEGSDSTVSQPERLIVPEGAVAHQGRWFEIAIPEGWTSTQIDSDVGYGYRTRFEAPDGSFVLVDISPDAGGSDIQSNAATLASGVSGNVYRAPEIEILEPSGREVWAFEFERANGERRIDMLFNVGPHGVAVLAGSKTDVTGTFAKGRTVADSMVAR